MTDNIKERLLQRLARRDLWPRSWWYPLPNPIEGLEGNWESTHKECSLTIRRVMLSILVFSAFCLLTLASTTDAPLVAGGNNIKVPFAQVGIHLVGFFGVAPFLLIIFTFYLHVFIGYQRRIEATKGNNFIPSNTFPTIFNIECIASSVLTVLIFYIIPSFVLFAFAWTSRPLIHIASLLTVVACITTSVLFFLLIRRTIDRRINIFIWMLVVFFIGSGLYIVNEGIKSESSFLESLRRPFNLENADLNRAVLRRIDLRDANLSGAVLTSAVLHNVDLRNANMLGVDLTGAKIIGGDFTGTNLQQVKFDNADLWVDHQNFKYANLRKASFIDTRITEEWTRKKWFSLIMSQGAFTCRIRDSKNQIRNERCIIYNRDNKHYYELSDKRLYIHEAISEAENSQYITKKNGEEICLQGYLVTVTSEEEHDFLNRYLTGRITEGRSAIWIGATDSSPNGVRGSSEGRWRWLGGPEKGEVFWAGGPAISDKACKQSKPIGKPVSKAFHRWNEGEPNNNCKVDDSTPEENYVGGGPVWNDVTTLSKLFPVIEYGGVHCNLIQN